jgi:hypothetical protein
MNPSDAHARAIVEPGNVLEPHLQSIGVAKQKSLLPDQKDSRCQLRNAVLRTGELAFAAIAASVAGAAAPTAPPYRFPMRRPH